MSLFKFKKGELDGSFLKFDEGDEVIFGIEEVIEADSSVTLVSRVIDGPHLDKKYNWRIRKFTAKGAINPEFKMLSKLFFTKDELESDKGADITKLVGLTYGVKVGFNRYTDRTTGEPKEWQQFTNVKNLGPLDIEKAFGD